MIKLIEPMNGEKPTHYIINNTSPKTWGTTYNDEELYKEAQIVDSIIYGKENIVSGKIEDLNCYVLVNELEACGGDSKANNKGKIL